MNRSVCRVMVGVAGLAVLGMTATLAGAQTDEVKEKPPLAAAADAITTLRIQRNLVTGGQDGKQLVSMIRESSET